MFLPKRLVAQTSVDRFVHVFCFLFSFHSYTFLPSSVATQLRNCDIGNCELSVRDKRTGTKNAFVAPVAIANSCTYRLL